MVLPVNVDEITTYHRKFNNRMISINTKTLIRSLINPERFYTIKKRQIHAIFMKRLKMFSEVKYGQVNKTSNLNIANGT
jgi:hypothetical protein